MTTLLGVIKHLPGKHSQKLHAGSRGGGSNVAKFKAAPRFTPDQITKAAGSHKAAVLKLGKHLASQKSRIIPDAYNALNKRGQIILSDVKNPRVGSCYTPSPGYVDRKLIAQDLNKLADDIDMESLGRVIGWGEL